MRVHAAGVADHANGVAATEYELRALAFQKVEVRLATLIVRMFYVFGESHMERKRIPGKFTYDGCRR